MSTGKNFPTEWDFYSCRDKESDNSFYLGCDRIFKKKNWRRGQYGRKLVRFKN